MKKHTDSASPSKPAKGVKKATSPGTATIRRILVPTDFSPASNNAVAYARDLAKQSKAELVLVHVILPAGSPDLIYGSILWDQEKMTDAARSALQKWQTEAGLGRVKKIKRQIRVGVPYIEIVEAARETKSDLIVIPTHGHTGLKHYLLGGTAERVVRHAGCPVLVVRAG
jgi:universal stress protein A